MVNVNCSQGVIFIINESPAQKKHFYVEIRPTKELFVDDYINHMSSFRGGIAQYNKDKILTKLKVDPFIPKNMFRDIVNCNVVINNNNHLDFTIARSLKFTVEKFDEEDRSQLLDFINNERKDFENSSLVKNFAYSERTYPRGTQKNSCCMIL
jgi:hypothetical protein